MELRQIFICCSFSLLFLLNFISCTQKSSDKVQMYEPTWNSLGRHATPEWFKDAKFGILSTQYVQEGY
jgi:alpha-L-fucosidase